MTYPMSPLKRALLPRREGAVTVGYWHVHDDAKNSRFFWWERADAEARYTPRRRDRRYRACREGSWEGGGSLVGAGDSVVPCGGHDASDDGKLHHRECNLLYFTRFGVILTGGTPRLGIPASQWHGEVLPPCHCGARIASMQYKCNAFNAKGVDFGEKLFDKIGQNRRGGEKRLPPVGEWFLVPEHQFWGKNTWNFFCFVRS